MIFRLEQKTFFLSARRPDTLLAWVENIPENGAAMRFRGSFLLYLGRFIGLKRIGRLSCESCFMLTFPLLYLRMPCPFVVFCERQKSWTVDRLFILQLARIAYFLVLPVWEINKGFFCHTVVVDKNKKGDCKVSFFCASGWAWTNDPLINSQVL